MLSVTSYPQDYIDHCRSLVDGQVASYEALLAAARKAGAKGPKVDGAVGAFESRFFNSMVLVLDQLFVHRARTKEGKDGNPLNEVRALCHSILQNGGVVAMPDKQIKLDPATSVLKLHVGDEISLTASDFGLLADGFFAEIQRTFS